MKHYIQKKIDMNVYSKDDIYICHTTDNTLIPSLHIVGGGNDGEYYECLSSQ